MTSPIVSRNRTNHAVNITADKTISLAGRVITPCVSCFGICLCLFVIACECPIAVAIIVYMISALMWLHIVLHYTSHTKDGHVAAIVANVKVLASRTTL